MHDVVDPHEADVIREGLHEALVRAMDRAERADTTDEFLSALREVSAEARRWEEHCVLRNGELLQPALLECEMQRFGMTIAGLLAQRASLLHSLKCSELTEIGTFAGRLDAGSCTDVISLIEAELKAVGNGFSHAMGVLRRASLQELGTREILQIVAQVRRAEFRAFNTEFLKAELGRRAQLLQEHLVELSRDVVTGPPSLWLPPLALASAETASCCAASNLLGEIDSGLLCAAHNLRATLEEALVPAAPLWAELTDAELKTLCQIIEPMTLDTATSCIHHQIATRGLPAAIQSLVLAAQGDLETTDLLMSLMGAQRAYQKCLDFRDRWGIEIEPSVRTDLDNLNAALVKLLTPERLGSFSQGLLDTMRECADTLALPDVVGAFNGEEERLIAAVRTSIWLARRFRGVEHMDDASLRALSTNIDRLSHPARELVTLAAQADAELYRRSRGATDQLALVLHSAP